MARMKQVKARWRGIAGFLAMACLALALLPGGAGRAEARSLSVALFPHVPDQARFRQAVEAEWNARHPEV